MLINESIRQCRISKGFTQKDIAEKLGLSKQFILQIEQGKRKIPVDRLIQIANILDCTLDDLVGRKLERKIKL